MKADLHVHTCLSPCGDLKMSPRAIAEQANKKNIDILGICDHNSAENLPALIQAAEKYKISVLSGIEVTSQEEVHTVALFNEPDSAFRLQEIVYQNLPGVNDEEAFGMQVVVNEKGEVLRFNPKLLIGASTLSVEEVTETIHSLQGLTIAAHIDREGFSLVGQLGFIPDHLPLDALEFSPLLSYAQVLEQFPTPHPLICSSDAHYLEDIGKGFTSFYLQEVNIEEIKMAFLQKNGRRVIH